MSIRYDIVLFTAICSAVVIAVMAWRFRRMGKASPDFAAWEQLTRSLDLNMERLDLAGTRRLEGRFGNCYVSLEETRHSGAQWLQYSVGGNLEPGIVLEKLSGHAVPSPKECRTGDEAFDAEVQCRGSEEEILALLGARARAELAPLILMGARFKDGFLTIEIPGPLVSASAADQLLRRMGAAMTALVDHPSDMPSALASNAEMDPNAEVRLRNLQMLYEHFQQTVQAGHAGERALEDGDTRLRLLGARLSASPAAAATLKQIAATLTEEGVPRAEALELLSTRLPREELLLLARAGLADRALPVRLKASALVGRLGDADSLPALLELALNLETAEAAARALWQLGDVRAQPTLLALLDAPVEEVRVAAARGLGRLGTVDAVPALHAAGAAAETGRLLRDACHQAVDAIQSRTSGDAGQLSVAAQPVDAGALSLPKSGGEVSLAPDDASLPDKGRVR